MNVARKFLTFTGACLIFLQFASEKSWGGSADPSRDVVPFAGRADYESDLFTGRFGYTVPIEIAPARGSAPRLALVYSSSGENDWLGLGWNIPVPFIQRDNRKGPVITFQGTEPNQPKYDDNYGFVANWNGGLAKLVQVSSDGNSRTFQAQEDKGSLATYVYNFSAADPHWVVTDKNGVKSYFGTVATGRISTTTQSFYNVNGQNVFRWMLQRVEDLNGNVTQYGYNKNNGKIYLQSVSYNTNPNDAGMPAHQVLFDLQGSARSDTTFSYATGERITQYFLLNQIRVYAGGSLVRKYALDYTLSTTTKRSLLHHIYQYGRNGNASAQFPTITFTYNTQQAQFASKVDWTGVENQGTSGAAIEQFSSIGFQQSTVNTTTERTGLFDIDGDGLPDRVMHRADGNNSLVVQKNTGTAFAGSTWNSWGLDLQGNYSYNALGFSEAQSCGGFSSAVKSLDLDGDGLPDRAIRGDGAGLKVQFNTGSGYSSANLWPGLADNGGYCPETYVTTPEVFLADMSGDGRIDRITYPNTGGWSYLQVQYNTGSGFGGGRIWTFPGADNRAFVTPNQQYDQFIDLNGDNMPDFVRYEPALARAYVRFNNGFGFTDFEIRPWYYATYIDINGDGLVDQVSLPGSPDQSPNYTRYEVRINNGLSFGNVTYWNNIWSEDLTSQIWQNLSGTIGGEKQVVTMADMNGDGLLDRVIRKMNAPFDRFYVQLNAGPFPDLLNKIENGRGGSVSVTYKSSTAYNNRDSTGKHRLPFPVKTVSQIIANNGQGVVATTAYNYGGGLFDAVAREFRGFNWVEVTDPLGKITRTEFHQGGGINGVGEFIDFSAKRGIPYKVEVMNASRTLLSKALSKVEVKQFGSSPDRYFPYVGQVAQFDYAANGTSSRIKSVQSEYDLKANLVTVTNFGEIATYTPSDHVFTDVGIDQSVKKITYHPSLNLPEFNRTYSDFAASQLLDQTQTAYDSRGNPTTSGVWDNINGVYLNTTRIFDTLGNNTQVTYPDGRVDTITYDSATRSHVAQKTTGTFTELFEVELATGQLKKQTDINGLVTQNGYDDRYRLTSVTVSSTANGTPDTLLRSIGYLDGTLAINSTANRSTETVNVSPPLITHVYFDGFGRTVQTRSEMEIAGSYRVVMTRYSVGGQAEFQSDTYFSSGENYSVTGTSVNSPIGTLTQFDSYGRIVSSTPSVSPQFNGSGVFTSYLARGGDSGSPNAASTVSYSEVNNPWVTIHADSAGKQKKQYFNSQNLLMTLSELKDNSWLNSSYNYNKQGKLISFTGPDSVQTQLEYDSLGRKTKLIDANAGTWIYKYNTSGQLSEQWNGNGHKEVLVYNAADPLRRLQYQHFYWGGSSFHRSITSSYDERTANNKANKGRRTTVVNRFGTSKYDYDLRGRENRSERTDNYPGYIPVKTFVTQTTYDNADRVQYLTYPTTIPTTLLYQYNAGGLLTQVQATAGHANIVGERFYLGSSFDENGSALSATYGTSVTRSKQFYTNSKRLKNLSAANGIGSLQNLTYSYDAVGNLMSIADSLNPSGTSSTLSSTTYDDLHRLTGITYANPIIGTRTFSYSSGGNLLFNGESANTYSYASPKPHAPSSANGLSYTYDNAGNVTQRGAQTIAYDVENAVADISDSSSIALTFGHDESLRRTWKYNGANSKTTFYVGELFESKNAQELCHVFANSVRVASFDAANPSATMMYNLQDHLQSASLVTDRSGTLIQKRLYSPFGREFYSSANVSISYRYTDQALDDETGLYWYGSRYYDPQLARFIQPDTIVSDLGNSQLFNRYSYVMNNPLRYNDPSGHAGVDVANWWSSGVDSYFQPYIQGTESWVGKGTLMTLSALSGGLLDPLAIGSDAGRVSAGGASGGQIAIAGVQEAFRAVSIVPVGSVAGKAANSLLRSVETTSLRIAAKTELTVIGHLKPPTGPGYVEVAESMGANYLKPSASWNWQKQGDFIKSVIQRGDDVLIGTPIRPGDSVLRHEIKQLIKAGYVPAEQGSKLLIKTAP